MAPGSLVRSSTAIAFTVAGSAATKCSTENGRYRRTFSSPTFSPAAVKVLNRLLRHFRAGAHHDDHALGVGRADVVEQMVLAAP